MRSLPQSDRDSDGEDVLTSSILSGTLSHTIRDLDNLFSSVDSDILAQDDADPDMGDARARMAFDDGGYCFAALTSECASPTGPGSIEASPRPQGHTPCTPVTLPEGCGDAALAALMRQHILPRVAKHLTSAHSTDVGAKLSSYTVCAALSRDPLSANVPVPSLSTLMPPPSEGMPGFARFEQYRQWLSHDKDNDGDSQLVPSPPRQGVPKTVPVSLFSGRRPVPCLASILLTSPKATIAPYPHKSENQKGECPLDPSGVSFCFDESMHPDTFSKKLSLETSGSEPRPSLDTAGSPLLTMSNSGTPTADRSVSTVYCSSSRVERARQSSYTSEVSLPSISLPPAQHRHITAENVLLLRSPTVASHSHRPSAFSSPIGSSLAVGSRDSAEQKSTGTRRAPSLFSRLFAPKRAVENDFSDRENVVCGSGSPRPRNRSASHVVSSTNNNIRPETNRHERLKGKLELTPAIAVVVPSLPSVSQPAQQAKSCEEG